MRGRSTPSGDLLSSWQWAAVTLVVVIAAVVLIVSSGPPSPAGSSAQDGEAEVVTAEVVDALGARGSANGEGLTRLELAAPTGLTNTVDGRGGVPTGTVDGPGRRLFGGVTVRLPRGKTPFRLRQIVPEDIDAAAGTAGFLKWDGYVAVLPGGSQGSSLPSRLTWQKAEAGGVRVPAGSVVRLRTMFRITDAAGRCDGPTTQSTRTGRRAGEALRRAPAWMVRSSGGKARWGWLRAAESASSADLSAVRSGPTASVLFRGSALCQTAQSTTTTDPDATAEATRVPGGAPLPADAPDGV